MHNYAAEIRIIRVIRCFIEQYVPLSLCLKKTCPFVIMSKKTCRYV